MVLGLGEKSLGSSWPTLTQGCEMTRVISPIILSKLDWKRRQKNIIVIDRIKQIDLAKLPALLDLFKVLFDKKCSSTLSDMMIGRRKKINWN